MTDGVELFRGIGSGAADVAHLPVSLGVFACPHVASGARPACNLNIAAGDVSVVCEDTACFDGTPEVTSLYRVIHFAPEIGALGPARDGWSFAREDADARWLAWPPGEDAPIAADLARRREH